MLITKIKTTTVATIVTILLLFSSQYASAAGLSGPAPHFATEETINIKNEINGDTMLVGQSIRVTKPINGDLFVIGENIHIDAPIKGDLRVIASSVEIKSRISGSFAFIAEEVLVHSTGEIDTDAYGISSKFALYGRVGRDLNLGYAEDADTLIEGNVAGNIHYLNRVPTLTKNSFLGGMLVKTDISGTKLDKNDMRLQIILGKILHSLSLILIAVLAMKLSPKKVAEGFSLYKKNILSNLLYGILSFLVFPLVIGVFFVSIVGIPIALMLSATIMFLIYVAPIYPATYIGQRFLPQSKSLLIPSICGILIFDVISMGPIVGSILYTFSIITFIGLLSKVFMNRRNRKTTK